MLLRLTAEWCRLLAPHGSICVELGDTYSGARGYGSEGSNPLYGERADERWRDARVEQRFKTEDDGWPLAKSLTLIPESYRWALAYGRNPFTGESPAGQWRVRNVVRWVRPNPPVGALGDKFRPATSELVVACISKDRYFDLDAVRDEYKTDGGFNWNSTDGPNPNRGDQGAGHFAHGSSGAPPLDWWKISPKGYTGAHYAVWPSELCVKPIRAMCPVRVCRTCGGPSRRITERTPEYAAAREAIGDFNQREGRGQGASGSRSVLVEAVGRDITSAENVTVGWSDCGHDDWRPGLVLDPFAGTGTTLAVAHGHGRDAIGIDLDPRNVSLARDRIGPLFLEVVEHGQARTQGETDRDSFLAEGSQRGT